MILIISNSQHSDRIRSTDPRHKSMEGNGYRYDEVESTLTVRHVRKSDEGVYRCTVTHHDSKTNYRETSIYVYGT